MSLKSKVLYRNRRYNIKMSLFMIVSSFVSGIVRIFFDLYIFVLDIGIVGAENSLEIKETTIIE